jgi:hypothetical protein
MAPNANNETITLAGGRKVEILPLPYQTWEEMEDARLEGLEQAATLEEEGKRARVNLVLTRTYRNHERSLLQARVKDWPAVKVALTVDEYSELVAILTKRSAKEAEPENLPAGGGGQPSQDAPATAGPAGGKPEKAAE